MNLSSGIKESPEGQISGGISPNRDAERMASYLGIAHPAI